VKLKLYVSTGFYALKKEISVRSDKYCKISLQSPLYKSLFWYRHVYSWRCYKWGSMGGNLCLMSDSNEILSL